MNPNAFPKVSVIIPTFNSASTLKMCLESVKNESYPNKEIIIIDNFSTDSTIQIAKQYGAKIILHKGFPSAARNKGVEHSSGDYVLFLDSDEMLKDGSIQDGIRLCDKGNDVVFFPPTFFGNDFWSSVRAGLRNEAFSIALSGKRRAVCDSPCLWVKRRFIQTLFDGSILYGEWSELHQRANLLGMKIAVSKYGSFHLEPSLKKTILKDIRYGYSSPKFPQANKHYVDLFIESLLVLKKIMESDRAPILKFASFILLLLRAIARATGFILGAIKKIMGRLK